MATLGCCWWTRCTVSGVVERGVSLTSEEGSAIKAGDMALGCFPVLTRPGVRGSPCLDGMGMLDLEASSTRPNTRERRSRTADAHVYRSIVIGSVGFGDGLTV